MDNNWLTSQTVPAAVAQNEAFAAGRCDPSSPPHEARSCFSFTKQLFQKDFVFWYPRWESGFDLLDRYSSSRQES
jgi:hypothetical protein